MVSAVAEALDLEAEVFGPFIGNPISALRALNYPATSEVTEEGQQRAGAHTAYGLPLIHTSEPTRPY